MMTAIKRDSLVSCGCCVFVVTSTLVCDGIGTLQLHYITLQSGGEVTLNTVLRP